MNKNKHILIILALLLSVLVCSCGKDNIVGDDTTDEVTKTVISDTEIGETKVVCQHQYEIIIHNPTCSSEGYTEKLCHKCGDSMKFDIKPKTEHKYGEDLITEPTCEEAGKVEHICEICGQADIVEVLEALGHDWNKGKVHAPNCTRYGYTEKTCSRCGETKMVDSIAPLGHSYGEWVITTEPTCQDEGERTATCTRCNKETTEEIEKLEHHYSEEPTCLRPIICLECGDSKEKTYPLWHDFDSGTVLYKTMDGVLATRYTCKVCGMIYDIKSNYEAPTKYVNTSIMRALEYIGYDVASQKKDGTLFTVYGDCPLVKKYLSPVAYDMEGKNGYEGNETVESTKSSTGLLPDIKGFKKRGLICASFTTYYLLNYLPNVEGLDIDKLVSVFNYFAEEGGYHLRAALTWHKALTYAEKLKLCEKIGTSAKNVDRSKLSPGDIIIFTHKNYTWSHVAIYAGTIDGEDFVVHCTGLRGVEITTLSLIADPYRDGSNLGSTVKEIFHIQAVTDHDANYKK